jgi:hypothetical protein
MILNAVNFTLYNVSKNKRMGQVALRRPQCKFMAHMPARVAQLHAKTLGNACLSGGPILSTNPHSESCLAAPAGFSGSPSRYESAGPPLLMELAAVHEQCGPAPLRSVTMGATRENGTTFPGELPIATVDVEIASSSMGRNSTCLIQRPLKCQAWNKDARA